MMLAFATAAPDLDEVSGPASGIRPKTAGFRQGLAALVGGRAGLVDRKMKADSARLTRVMSAANRRWPMRRPETAIRSRRSTRCGDV